MLWRNMATLRGCRPRWPALRRPPAPRHQLQRRSKHSNPTPATLAGLAHRSSARRRAASLRPPRRNTRSCAQPFIIGVTGGTASGKTSVCRSIVEKLVADGVRTKSAHLVATHRRNCALARCTLRRARDTWWTAALASSPAPKTASPTQREDIASYTLDHADASDFGQISCTLRALRRGEAVDIPIYNFVTIARARGGRRRRESRRGAACATAGTQCLLQFMSTAALASCYPVLELDAQTNTCMAVKVRRVRNLRGENVLRDHMPGNTWQYLATFQVILFDGILAFYAPEVRGLLDLKVFVEAEADVRLARRLRRDIADRGRQPLQVRCIIVRLYAARAVPAARHRRPRPPAAAGALHHNGMHDL
jgi:uridine kinase